MSAPAEEHPQNPLHQYGHSGSDVTHSKEDALSGREFELLLEGAAELSRDTYYYAPDPEMMIYTLGRLGLRRGELVHLEGDWIDWREEQIQIPAHSPCDRGQNGAVCGDCRQSARQRVEYAEDDLDEETAREWMWTPKSEAGVRTIYFGHDTRARLYLERYFASDAYDRVEVSGSAVSRRVEKAAELAPELDPEDVYPHCLRATAATRFSSLLDVYALKQVMGWERLATSKAYISSNAESTAQQLDATGSR